MSELWASRGKQRLKRLASLAEGFHSHKRSQRTAAPKQASGLRYFCMLQIQGKALNFLQRGFACTANRRLSPGRQSHEVFFVCDAHSENPFNLILRTHERTAGTQGEAATQLVLSKLTYPWIVTPLAIRVSNIGKESQQAFLYSSCPSCGAMQGTL
jgi:hypothetical protein